MSISFKNILVFRDSSTSSTRAIKFACDLAGESGGNVTVMDVVKEPPWIWREAFANENWEAEERDRRFKDLHELISGAGFDTNKISLDVRVGRPITEIVRKVIEAKHDLLIKPANSVSAELFFGSLDMRLMRYCPVPLVLIKPGVTVRLRKILAAVDPQDGPHVAELNEQIVRYASSLSMTNDAELHLVAAWQAPGFNFDYDDENVRRYEEEKDSIEKKIRRQLQAIIEKSLCDVFQENIHLDNLYATDAIVEVTRAIAPDLLVMGSVARSGIPGLLIGNTAELTLRRVKCAVMILKPLAFVSPIESAPLSDGDD